jgi:hypothetical protein
MLAQRESRDPPMRTIRAIAALTALIATLVLSLSAHAAGTLHCENYVAEALEQNDWNKRLACRYTGPRWSDDGNHHKSWCRVSKVESTNGERITRAGDLDRCYCANYAREAMRQNAINLQNSCGFEGVRWHGSFDWHHNWCVGLGKGSDGLVTKFGCAGCLYRGDGEPAKHIAHRNELLAACPRTGRSQQPLKADPPKMRIVQLAYGAVRYERPTIADRGRIYWLDFCRLPGRECGKSAASSFCWEMNFGKPDVVSFTARPGAWSTMSIATKQQCIGSHCAGFEQITCANRATYEFKPDKPIVKPPIDNLKPR